MVNNGEEHTNDFPFDKTWDEFADYMMEEYTHAFDRNIINMIMSETDYM